MFDSRFPRPETHDSLPGVVIYPFKERRVTRMCIDPEGKIPFHTHNSDEEFTVVAGSGSLGTQVGPTPSPYWNGRWLSDLPRITYVRLAPGDCHVAKADTLHGLRAGESGLVIEIPWKEDLK